MSLNNILKDERKIERIAKACFRSVDRDGSGFIDIKELENVMRTISSDLRLTAPTSEDIKYVFKVLDDDESGCITYKEFKFLIQCVLEYIC